jgi:Lipase (class 3)
MKNKYQWSLELVTSALLVVSSSSLAYAETLKDVCSSRNSECDAILYTSKVIAPTYSKDIKDRPKVIEDLRDLGWSLDDKSFIDVQNFKNSEGNLVDVDTQAIIAKRTIDGKNYYLISFRGTDGNRDRLTDTIGGASTKKIPGGGEVHQGFYDYTNAVFSSPEFRQMLEDINADKSYEVLLTGHSLGGAAAQIMLYFLKNNYGLPNEKIKTIVFGSPSPGNQSYADAYLKSVVRVEIDRDIVPYLRNFGTSVNYGKKVYLPPVSWATNEFEAHGQYAEQIDRIYEPLRLAWIKQKSTMAEMNAINSCYTSQGAAQITSATCYVSRPAYEDLIFKQTLDIKKGLPEGIQQKNQYTDGTIVRAPIDIGLTWNQETNLDLDSHTVITPNNSTITSTTQVYFAKPGSLTDTPGTFLYRDSIPAAGRLGAEQTRIAIFQDGEYRFYVYNFSDQSNTSPTGLPNSLAKVQIFQGGDPLNNIINDPNIFKLDDPKLQKVGQPYPGNNTFNVPTDQSGNTWYVFKLNPRTGILQPINRFGNAPNSTSVPSIR